MLVKLKLFGFQIHKKLILELERVTTFVGDSDQGKSAIIRAIYWLVFGRPLGESFINDELSSCKVSIHDSDGNTVTRRRVRAGHTSYKVNDQVLKAFGTDVPEQVRRILNLNETNFQRQLDPPFWLLDSPGQVAKNLNSIVNLGLIDSVMLAASRKVSEAKTQVEYTTTRIDETNKEIDSLQWVRPCLLALKKIDKKRQEVKKLRIRTESLHLTLNRGRSLVEERWGLVAQSEALSAVLRAVQKARELDSRVDRLSALLNTIDELKEKKGTNAAAIMLDLLTVKKAIDTKATLEDKINKLDVLLNSVVLQKDYYDKCVESLAQAEVTLKRKFPKGVCPLCQTPLPSSSPTCTSPTKHHRPE